MWTILPIHLAELAGSDEPVGYYLAVVAAIGIGASLASSALFTRTRRLYIGFAALLTTIALLVGMSAADTLVGFALFDVPRSIAFLMLTMTLGLLVRDHSTLADLPVQEGRYYLFSNLGWLIGPVMAGYLASALGNEAVFVGAALTYGLGLVYLWTLHLTDHRPLQSESPVESVSDLVRLLVEFIARPRLRRVFTLALGLEVWWVVASIYIPLAVVELGFGVEVVGWVVTGGIIPLVVLEAWVGRQAARRGIRRFLVTGFMFLAVVVASFLFLEGWPRVLLFVFAAVNIGAALVEPLVDTYFFEVADETEEDRYFGIYNAAAPIGGFVGPLVAGVAITLGLGLDGVWAFAAVAMAATGIVATRVAPDM